VSLIGNTMGTVVNFGARNVARQISSITGRVVLRSADNPLTITRTGQVIASGTGEDGIDGASGTKWTISNAGTISSSSQSGISLAGSGTITNTGRISGLDAILLQAGGSVANKANGTITGKNSGIHVTHGIATVTNAGSISGPGKYAITLDGGGSITNTGSLVGGEDGVRIQGTIGKVVNSGLIKATVDDGIGIFAGGSVQNNVGGTITGAGAGGAGIFITGGAGTITNSGSIADVDHFGILLSSGKVTNSATGSILGSVAGIAVNAGAGTITNAGSIISTAASGAGIDLEAGGSVANSRGGSVSGGNFGVFITGGTGTVTNSGKITGAIYDGVLIASGGNVTNQAGGSISGGSSGVFLALVSSVANSGSITGPGTGADFEGGGSFTNNVGGSVSGGGFGVFVTGGSGTVTNNGTIGGSHGVALETGGSVANKAHSTITGAVAGVFIQGGAGTLTNAGTIVATDPGGAGADIEGGGSITNDSGASLSGSAFGVFLTGGSGTVTNGGTISGASYAVSFSDTGTNRLVVKPSAVFVGAVGGGASASNTLELAGGSGAIAGLSNGSGTVTQNGQSWLFTQFGSIVFDTGSHWTLNGTDAAATLVNNGTLDIKGSLNVTTAVDPASTGLFQIDSGATLEIASMLGGNTQMQFLSSSKLVIDDAGSFGTSVGGASFAGPLLQGFSAGNVIDVKNFGLTGAALNYNGATGILQVTNGASQTANLHFQASSIGSGAFQVAADSTNGIAITHA